MRHFGPLLITLLALANIAFLAVGNAAVSDNSYNSQQGQSYQAEIPEPGGLAFQSPGYQAVQPGSGYQKLQEYPQVTGYRSPPAGYQPYAATEGQPFYQGAQAYLSGNVWPAVGANSGYNPSAPLAMSLPAGAPIPPDPNAENLALPDFKLLLPNAGQTAYSSPGSYPASSGYLAQSNYPAPSTCYGCSAPSSYGTQGDQAQNYQAVYPRPASCRCNEYYIQTWLGKLNTAAAVKCGEWLSLRSKIGKPGIYWSFEWTQCSLGYCYPEVKNFGHKGTGWCETWFRGNKPGWHILTYYCSDWSNYIYIYVWPAS